MTTEDQNIAISEYLGWKNIREIDYEDHVSGEVKHFWGGCAPGCVFEKETEEIPKFTKDLNEMHLAEKNLKDLPRPVIIHSEMTCYVSLLDKITGNEGWHATASQRSEAFLKTIGKWEESK